MGMYVTSGCLTPGGIQYIDDTCSSGRHTNMIQHACIESISLLTRTLPQKEIMEFALRLLNLLYWLTSVCMNLVTHPPTHTQTNKQTHTHTRKWANTIKQFFFVWVRKTTQGPYRCACTSVELRLSCAGRMVAQCKWNGKVWLLLVRFHEYIESWQTRPGRPGRPARVGQPWTCSHHHRCTGHLQGTEAGRSGQEKETTADMADSLPRFAHPAPYLNDNSISVSSCRMLPELTFFWDGYFLQFHIFELSTCTHFRGFAA